MGEIVIMRLFVRLPLTRDPVNSCVCFSNVTVQFMMSALLFELHKIYTFRRSVEGVTICVVLALVVLCLLGCASNIECLYLHAVKYTSK